MKKFMLAAAAALMVGSAFAADVYDYKASVKYVDLKPTKMKISGYSYNMYIKVVKTAKLEGYVVTTECCDGIESNTGFLVVTNKKSDKMPKFLPAQLMAKIWNTKYNAKTSNAEGYLFTGLGKAAVPWNDSAYAFGDGETIASRLLFGGYNDGTYVSADEDPIFFEAWMDHSGFGKASFSTTSSNCGVGSTSSCLDSLAGHVIGGMYLCHTNGDGEFITEDFACMPWTGTSDVISGTWQIKRNNKLDPVAADVEAVNSTQDILDYSATAAKKIKSGYALSSVDEAFRNKWF